MIDKILKVNDKIWFIKFDNKEIRAGIIKEVEISSPLITYAFSDLNDFSMRSITTYAYHLNGDGILGNLINGNSLYSSYEEAYNELKESLTMSISDYDISMENFKIGSTVYTINYNLLKGFYEVVSDTIQSIVINGERNKIILTKEGKRDFNEIFIDEKTAREIATYQTKKIYDTNITRKAQDFLKKIPGTDEYIIEIMSAETRQVIFLGPQDTLFKVIDKMKDLAKEQNDESEIKDADNSK